MEEDDEMQLMTEVEILSQLDHPNAVKLYEVFDMSDRLFLVLELLS
jgi:calcium/calmodulin-dependent protein kinase I